MPKDSIIRSQHISLHLNSLSRAVYHTSFHSHQISINKAVLYTSATAVSEGIRPFLLSTMRPAVSALDILSGILTSGTPVGLLFEFPGG